MPVARARIEKAPTPQAAAILSVSLARPTDQKPESSEFESIGSVSRFARNATVFSDGDNAICSYKVVSGTVRLVKLLADGRRHIVGFVIAGDLFGVERTKEHALSAEAVTDVVALRYQRGLLERLSEERTEIRNQLLDRLRRDLRAAQDHLFSLGCQSARERVASFLLFQADRTGGKDGEALGLPMGRQDIADYLGLTIETVCRILSDLKSDGVIAIPNRHELVIRSSQRLRNLAGVNA